MAATLTGLERARVGDVADKVGEYFSGIGDDLCESGEASQPPRSTVATTAAAAAVAATTSVRKRDFGWSQ